MNNLPTDKEFERWFEIYQEDFKGMDLFEVLKEHRKWLFDYGTSCNRINMIALFDHLRKLGGYEVENDIDGSEEAAEEAIARWIIARIEEKVVITQNPLQEISDETGIETNYGIVINSDIIDHLADSAEKMHIDAINANWRTDNLGNNRKEIQDL